MTSIYIAARYDRRKELVPVALNYHEDGCTKSPVGGYGIQVTMTRPARPGRYPLHYGMRMMSGGLTALLPLRNDPETAYNTRQPSC